MIAVRSSSALKLAESVPVLEAPEIIPAPPPAYVPPVSTPMALTPIPAPPPTGQTLGTGGTVFALSSGAMRVAPFWTRLRARVGGTPYTDTMPTTDKPLAPPAPSVPAPGGAGTIIRLPDVRRPQKPRLGDATEPVTVPAGPVKGNIAGFDLATVPLWAWLVAAAVVGWKFFGK